MWNLAMTFRSWVVELAFLIGEPAQAQSAYYILQDIRFHLPYFLIRLTCYHDVITLNSTLWFDKIENIWQYGNIWSNNAVVHKAKQRVTS